ncbi:MAG: hypothetical protein OXF74_06715 [Rhodobacteraceae bacterium]|nr:hypothetical protein [Paracoccaceae bacterium]
MAKAAEKEHERVHLRLDFRSKRKLERAAAYEETTLSRFVLLNPPPPNAALKRAARCYRELIGG